MSLHFLQQALVFLAAALICVPIAKKLGLGSVLGYLLAGVLIGPFGLGFIGTESEDIMHGSEFGVVMMLFLIGLELNPQAFWQMRKAIAGLGLSQLILTILVLSPLLYFVFGFDWVASLVASMAFAMSSTAIIMQTLKEKDLTGTQAGRGAFAVLLLQDVAVIPILALLPLLALTPAAATSGDEAGSWLKVLISLAAIGGLVVASRYLVNPALRLIGRLRLRELFTVAALFLVVGVSYLMMAVGLSAALGAFLAGVLLANSEYRHELESDVEPFKGLLLGVFFTAVGSTINFQLIAAEPAQVFGLVATVMLLKAWVIFLIGKKFGFRTDQNLLFAVLLCQVGEFAFVLLSAATQVQILEKHGSEILMAVTTITMGLSPLLIFANERWIAPRFGTRQTPDERPADHIEEKHQVIIAGFGHFGSTFGRFLRANGVEATILDNDSDRVELLRKMGFKVYYGDSTRLDLLRAAGADSAKYLVSALDEEDQTLALVELAQKHFPQLKILMRSKHRSHSYDLMKAGLTKTYRESLHGSVFMGADLLAEMGFRRYTAYRKAQEFIKYDEIALAKLAKDWGNREQYLVSVREEIALQEKLLSEDVRFVHDMVNNAWDSEQLRNG